MPLFVRGCIVPGVGSEILLPERSRMGKRSKKRANGDGSIYKRKDGRWVGQYTDKHRKTRYIYGKTRDDVKIKLNKVLADLDNGLVFDEGNLALGQHLDRWLEESVRHAVKPTTYESYSQLVRNHITPALGSKKAQGPYSRLCAALPQPET
jgi:hypothetical protein